MNLRRFTPRLSSLKVALTLTAFLCGLLSVRPATEAISIYDASVSLDVSTWTVVPFKSSLTLLPGVTVTPPPFVKGNGQASRSATANVPGHVTANASGVAVGLGCVLPFFECPGGEQPTDDTLVTSRATAIGLGFLSAINNVSFPLAIHEKWSVAAFSNSIGAGANISSQVLVDGALIYDGAASATAYGLGFDSKDATTRLRVPLTAGVHSLLFIAEADGLAATPEPTTLLLVGTTAAGLGLARWRRWRQNGQP